MTVTQAVACIIIVVSEFVYFCVGMCALLCCVDNANGMTKCQQPTEQSAAKSTRFCVHLHTTHTATWLAWSKRQVSNLTKQSKCIS